MSVDYSIACVKCKKSLWVAQSSWKGDGFTFYSGHPEIMEKLGLFFKEHMGHSLIFDEDQNFDDYEEL